MKIEAAYAPAIVVGMGCIAGVVVYPELADTHVRSVLPPPMVKSFVVFGLPSAAIVTYLILRRLWSEAIGEDEIDPMSEVAHRAVAVRLVVFTMALHGLVLLKLSGIPWIDTWAPRLVVVLFGGMIIVIGNLMPRTRPNLALGIRTRRTLTDRQLWIRIHRICGYVAVALGTIVVISGLFLNNQAMELVIGIAALGSAITLAACYRAQQSARPQHGTS